MRRFCSKCRADAYATSTKKLENVMLRIGCLENGHGVNLRIIYGLVKKNLGMR